MWLFSKKSLILLLYILNCICYTLFFFCKSSKYLVPSVFPGRIHWGHHCKCSFLYFLILLMVFKNRIYFNIQNLFPATLINFTNSNYFVYSLLFSIYVIILSVNDVYVSSFSILFIQQWLGPRLNPTLSYFI